MPMPKITMKKAEFRVASRKIVLVAETIASFTKTEKDDQVVAIFSEAFNNDELFAKLCEVLGIEE